MKKIAILGSTGSIGTQTLEVARENGDLQITALAAGNNIELLEKQIREFHPGLVAVWKEEKAKELKDRVKDLDVKVVCGMDGLLEVATEPSSEIQVTAIVGMIGIRPTIAAMKAGKDIALANKETLVTAGHIIIPLAKECNVQILPVDSEHSAIFQCLNGEHRSQLKKILLTASGGPFRGKKKEELTERMGREPTVEELATSLGTEKEELVQAMEAATEVESIYRPIHQEGDSQLSILDRLEEKSRPEEHLLNRMMLSQILDGLDKEERQLIYLRYFQEKTQAAVGEILGISQVQVSRMEKKILERMRKQM